jgi:hypothetical protein
MSSCCNLIVVQTTSISINNQILETVIDILY